VSERDSYSSLERVKCSAFTSGMTRSDSGRESSTYRVMYGRRWVLYAERRVALSSVGFIGIFVSPSESWRDKICDVGGIPVMVSSFCLSARRLAEFGCEDTGY